MTNKKKLLIIGFVWPEPNSSAAGRRMMQLITLFLSGGWQITFACAASESEHAADLEEQGIECVRLEINSADFDDFLKRFRPSMVLFDRFVTEEQFGWRVARHCPQALRVLDTEDLHFLRRTRRKCVERDILLKEEQLLTGETAKREIASVLRCDLSLIISEFEMKLLQDVFEVDTELLYYLPLFADTITADIRAEWPDFEGCSHFMTIGNFSHAPNADAVSYLRQDIWPAIREELPEAEMHVFGAYPDSHSQQWHSRELGFFVKGRVDDAREVMKSARVCLAPLRFGAGLKGKLLEAMQCGTPSVTTSIGAEGINGNLPWGGAIADNEEAFTSAAVDLYRNASRWNEARERGASIINSRFRKELFGKVFLNKLQQIADNLEAHRLQNFTGAMLRHHTMASTEYMSRWIEAKNRNGSSGS